MRWLKRILFGRIVTVDQVERGEVDFTSERARRYHESNQFGR